MKVAVVMVAGVTVAAVWLQGRWLQRRWWEQQWWHGRVGAGAPQVSMDQVRGVWTSQDRRSEEHTKASESAMVVMD
jgi:hypothetical protein